MRRSEWRSLAIAVCTILSAVGPAVSEIVLDTAPAGAFVRIEGPMSFSGRTPMSISTWPQGSYRLEVLGAGLASARARVESSHGNQLRIRSTSRPQALLLPPGTEHFRGGESWRGLTFLGAGGFSGAALWIEESDRRDAEDALGLAQDAYESAQSEIEIDAARIAVLAADAHVEDETEMRNLWTAYLGAVWVGSALESWLLTPRIELLPRTDGGYIVKAPRAGAWPAGWRSLLVPGSGQRYLGRQLRANLVSLAVLGFAAGTLIAHEELLDAEREQAYVQQLYDAAQTESALLFLRRELLHAADRTSDRDTARWTLVGLTCGAYLWNLLDAVLVGRDLASPTRFGAVDDPATLRWSVSPLPQGVQARMVWSLP